jgi:trehalose-phosphatase
MSDAAPTPNRSPAWALGALPEIRRHVGERRPVFFLDLDGTLAPIAERPDLVELPTSTREVLERLVQEYVVCLISGRGLEDLRRVVGIQSVFYAANHGHEIVGPPASGVVFEAGAEQRRVVEALADRLGEALRLFEGAIIENKGLSVAVHYRLVHTAERPAVKRRARGVLADFPSVRVLQGKLVCDLLPPGAWDKGRAVIWLLERLGLGRDTACPVCLGDDLTDEDMFTAIAGWGVSVVVGGLDRPTEAVYRLADGGEVAAFLEAFAFENRGQK